MSKCVLIYSLYINICIVHFKYILYNLRGCIFFKLPSAYEQAEERARVKYKLSLKRNRMRYILWNSLKIWRYHKSLAIRYYSKNYIISKTWKKSKIIALLKPGKPELAISYIPISPLAPFQTPRLILWKIEICMDSLLSQDNHLTESIVNILQNGRFYISLYGKEANGKSKRMGYPKEAYLSRYYLTYTPMIKPYPIKPNSLHMLILWPWVYAIRAFAR